jgi:hypothetical protein
MNELKCWFVGVHWASENHRVRIADCCGKRLTILATRDGEKAPRILAGTFNADPAGHHTPTSQ